MTCRRDRYQHSCGKKKNCQTNWLKKGSKSKFCNKAKISTRKWATLQNSSKPSAWPKKTALWNSKDNCSLCLQSLKTLPAKKRTKLYCLQPLPKMCFYSKLKRPNWSDKQNCSRKKSAFWNTNETAKTILYKRRNCLKKSLFWNLNCPTTTRSCLKCALRNSNKPITISLTNAPNFCPTSNPARTHLDLNSSRKPMLHFSSSCSSR